MNAVSGRHISLSRLSLRTSRKRDAESFRNDLEDALRTATLPDQATGSMLHIRRLDLGRLRRGMSRQALAAHLAVCLGKAQIGILRWNEAPPPDSADIVLIPDLVTASALALKSVIDATPPHPAIIRAFPHLESATTPSERVAETLQRLIAATSAAGPGRIAELPGGLDLMVRALETLPDATIANLAPTGLITGLSDDRATVSVEASEPSIAPGTFTRPGTIGRSVAAEIENLVPDAPRAMRRAAELLIPHSPAGDLRTATLLTWIAAAAEGPSAITRMPARFARLYAAAARSIPSISRTSVSYIERLRRDTAASTPTARQSRNAPKLVTSKMRAENTAQIRTDAVADEHPDGTIHPRAGFWFLVNVLHHLACDEAGRAMVTPLMRATLAHFATRMALNEGDPIGNLFETLDCEFTLGPEASFMPHKTVLDLLAGTRGLCAEPHGDATALSLRPSTSFFAYSNTADLAKLSLHPARGIIRDPVTGMALAAQRLITQLLGGRGWRWLVNRPGHIVVTPTHIDVTFDGVLADSEIRIAGLDLNPGWVPELGRVINFHYDYSALRDHGGGPT